MAAAEAAATRVGATIVGRYSVAYQPHGLTVSVFLAESHIILTTWPELDLLLVDSLLCNPQMNNDDVLDEVRSRLCPRGKVVTQTFGRWIAADPPESAGD
jgi:S-adenosylmethionine decarboxylase